MPDSEPTPPPVPRGSARAWGVAVVVWLTTLGVFELVVRQRGFLVSREGPAALSIRRAIDEIEPGDIVVIGSSETAAGIDLDILSGTLHHRVRLLTAWGATPYLLFEFLLQRRPDFRGQVILSLTFATFSQRATGFSNELRRLVRSASSVTPAQRASEAITDWLATGSCFAIRNSMFGPNFSVSCASRSAPTHPSLRRASSCPPSRRRRCWSITNPPGSAWFSNQTRRGPKSGARA